jgi:NTE family protein
MGVLVPWGALDRLLKEPGVEIDGISATSAGAMNAVVLAHGLTVDEREGAADALRPSGSASTSCL